MKTPLRNCDGKMFTIEEGETSSTDSNCHREATSPKSRAQRTANRFKIFKWFITINVFILLIFCGYALWSLYQLESAMRSRDGYLSDMSDKSASAGNTNAAELNDSVVISDFQEWRLSILKSLENLQENRENKTDSSHNLKFLLHTITSIVKNFIDNDRLNAEKDPRLIRNKLVITNLTDFEMHILKEFTRLKMLENRINVKSRVARTVKNVRDESACNLQFSFYVKEENPLRVTVRPAKKGEGQINIRNTVNDLTKGVTDVRECSFNIVYESK